MKTIHTFNEIRINDLLDSYWDKDRFLELCKNCENYGKLWSCPPYDFNIYDYIMEYSYVYIIGSRMIFAEETIKSNNKEKIQNFTKSTLETMRNSLGEKLLGLENEIKNGKSLYAGSCLICENCSRENGENCCNVDMMRYSLESLGFDVSKIAASLLDIELKWASDTLPEYFTLVSAFMSKERIKDYESTFKTMFN